MLLLVTATGWNLYRQRQCRGTARKVTKNAMLDLFYVRTTVYDTTDQSQTQVNILKHLITAKPGCSSGKTTASSNNCENLQDQGAKNKFAFLKILLVMLPLGIAKSQPSSWRLKANKKTAPLSGVHLCSPVLLMSTVGAGRGFVEICSSIGDQAPDPAHFYKVGHICSRPKERLNTIIEVPPRLFPSGKVRRQNLPAPLP